MIKGWQGTEKICKNYIIMPTQTDEGIWQQSLSHKRNFLVERSKNNLVDEIHAPSPSQYPKLAKNDTGRTLNWPKTIMYSRPGRCIHLILFTEAQISALHHWILLLLSLYTVKGVLNEM